MSERYQIMGKLGRGGIGAVYRGYDAQLDREVAIKRLLPIEETQLNQADTGSLSREASALAKFQHPNVVTIFGFEEDSEGPFVVTELIKGENLKVTIEKGALSVRDFQEFVSQTLDALIAAEQLNLLHRDIKPANLMLLFLPSGKFQVKILDFGLAKFSQNPSTQTLDHKGSFLGSIDYIAPEQIDRRPLDQRTDLYSLGCVCYFALTQKPPFEGKNMADTMKNHLSHNVIPITEIRPDLPEAIGAWVMRMISLRPSHRPRNATQAVQEFEQSKVGIVPTIPDSPQNGEDSTPVASRPGTQGNHRTYSSDTSTQPTTPDGRKILTQPMVDTPQRTTVRTRVSRKRTSDSIRSKGSSKKFDGLTGPLISLALAAILLLGMIVYLVKSFSSGNNDFDDQPAETTTAQKAPERPSELGKSIAGTSSNAPAPSNPKDRSSSIVPLPPITENLIAHYSALDWVFGKGFVEKATVGEEVHAWGNLAPDAKPEELLSILKTQWIEKFSPPVLGKTSPSEDPTLLKETPFLTTTTGHSLMLLGQAKFLDNISETPLSIFMVTRSRTVEGQPNGRLFSISGKLSSDGPQVNATGFIGFNYNPGQFGVSHKAPDGWKFVGANRTPGKFGVVCFQWDGASGTAQTSTRLADGKTFVSQKGPAPKGLYKIRNYSIGSTNARPIDADFAEVLIYNSYLPPTSRDEIIKWLARRYFVE